MYLDNPDWATESDLTTSSKKASLKDIEMHLNNSVNITKCYQAVRAVIESHKDSLTADINPHSFDFINYFYYWLMKLCRALKAIVTRQSYINKKDDLFFKLTDSVSRRPLSEFVVDQTLVQVDPETLPENEVIGSGIEPDCLDQIESELESDVTQHFLRIKIPV